MPYPADAFATYATIAARLGTTFNSGYLARLDPRETDHGCAEDAERFAGSGPEPTTLYIVHPGAFPSFVDAGAKCAVLDGVVVCVAGRNRDVFAVALAHLRGPL